MSNTISLEELKNLSLPCLPKNLESIRYRAKTQDWPYIEEAGKARGGRLKKYLIASLPAEIRAAIMKRQSDELAEKMPKMLPQVRPGTAMSAQALAEAAKLLNEKQRSVADARCAVVAAVLGIKYQYGCSCILESPYHSNKPPGRHPRPPKADNRCVAQGGQGNPSTQPDSCQTIQPNARQVYDEYPIQLCRYRHRQTKLRHRRFVFV